MIGLELLKAPDTTAGEIADIVSEHCPPLVPTNCDRLSCRECWLSWLATGKPPREDDGLTDPDEDIDLTRLRVLLRELDIYMGSGEKKGPSDGGTAQGEELARLKLLLREIDDYVNGKSRGHTS